ncbi:unnamed protein product [Effrenium voratum]|uniref:Apple domain-containing protein n=1 Tax=Effrenium voratum TaxID=2562239 RepID=A0AA36HMI3_9DINO|nr:unnamed protein product [Effrenium voratum]
MARRPLFGGGAWAILLPLVAGKTPGCAVFGQGYKDAGAPPALPNGAFLIDAASCQASCDSNPTCQHFTWLSSSHACWLGSESAELVQNLHAISGPKACSLAPAVPAPVPPTFEISPVFVTEAPKVLAQPATQGSNFWLWLLAAVLALLLCGLAAYHLGGTKKVRESARKRHQRRTQGLHVVEEEEEDEAPVESPLMPWDQRKLGFQAPVDGFVRLPLQASTAPASQQSDLFPTHRYVVS